MYFSTKLLLKCDSEHSSRFWSSVRWFLRTKFSTRNSKVASSFWSVQVDLSFLSENGSKQVGADPTHANMLTRAQTRFSSSAEDQPVEAPLMLWCHFLWQPLSSVLFMDSLTNVTTETENRDSMDYFNTRLLSNRMILCNSAASFVWFLDTDSGWQPETMTSSGRATNADDIIRRSHSCWWHHQEKPVMWWHHQSCDDITSCVFMWLRTEEEGVFFTSTSSCSLPAVHAALWRPPEAELFHFILSLRFASTCWMLQSS